MALENEPSLDRLRGCDAEAWAAFLEDCRPRLSAYIEKSLSDALRRKIEAQDIFQEVSIHCLRSLREVDLAGRDPFGWLCEIADRRIIDAHRRFFGSQKRAADREVALDAPAGNESRGAFVDLLVVTMTTPSQAFSRDARHMRLAEAVACLPDANREALRMRYVEGLPTKQIAERLGRSDGAVRVMLTRTLARLQELLGSDAAP